MIQTSRLKRILLICVIAVMALILCGCGNKMPDAREQILEKNSRFRTVETYDYGYIAVDTETNVEYWISDGTYNRGTITLLVEPDGKPKLMK